MAKWVYEKWTVKWDDSTLEGATQEPNSKIDPTTFVMSSANDFFTGDLGVYVSNTARSGWNSGSLELGNFILSTPSGYMYAGYPNSYNHEMWQYRVKDTLIETLTAEEGTYPDDGIHTDGYWYVKIKLAFPTMRILRDGQWAEVETGFVLKDGVWKPIEEIYKLQDGQWVQA